MRIKVTQAERGRSDMLATQCLSLMRQCAELDRIDRISSPISRETVVLGEITEYLMASVDNGRLRLNTCLDLMECTFRLQQRALDERRAQIATHNAS